MNEKINDLKSLVNDFSEAMKTKLIKKYRQGYYGWQEMNIDLAIEMLNEHIKKGDMIDVANLAAFIWYRRKNVPSSRYGR